jgi:hypothetical protein
VSLLSKKDRMFEREKKRMIKSDYLVTDILIGENKLNAIKLHRQELRDFINKLVNDEIECNLIDDEFEKKYFPKLILDGSET